MFHRTPRPSLAVPWRATDVLVALVLVAAVWAVAATTQNIVQGGWSTALLLAYVLEGALLMAAVFLGPIRRRASLRALGFRSPPPRGRVLLPVGVVVLSLTFTGLYVLIIQVLGLSALVPEPLPSELREVALGIPGFLLIVLWGPLAEETFFRGFAFPAFLGPMGLVGAVGASSALFALSHGVVGLIIPAFFSGVLLTLLYNWTGSLWSVWLAHALQNALSFTLGA